MEDWLLEAQKLKQDSGMPEDELQALYNKIPEWVAKVEEAMHSIGSGQLDEAKSGDKPHFP